MKEHRYDIDALRVFACYLQFVFHAGKVFDPDPIYHVKAAETFETIGWLTQFLHAWRMPLFFFVAGWSAITLLQRRSPGRFIRERLRRLLPPLLFGVIVIAPVIKYIELRGGIDIRPNGLYAVGSFNEPFIKHYFHFFTNMRRFSYSHIWFLFYLIFYLILLLPVLMWIARSERLPCRASVVLLVPIAGVAISEILLRARFPDFPNLYADWANHARYTQFFLAGGLVARHRQLDEALARGGLWLGAAGLAAGGLMIALPHGPLRCVLDAVVAWGCIGGLYALLRHRTPPDASLRRLSDSTIALYVLHHGFLVAIASWVVASNLTGWPGLLTVAVLSLLVTQFVYEIAVRNVPWMRLALGMRADQGKAAAPVVVSRPA